MKLTEKAAKQIAVLASFYQDDIEFLKTFKDVAGKGSEEDHESFNLSMGIFKLEEAIRYLSKVSEPRPESVPITLTQEENIKVIDNIAKELEAKSMTGLDKTFAYYSGGQSTIEKWREDTIDSTNFDDLEMGQFVYDEHDTGWVINRVNQYNSSATRTYDLKSTNGSVTRYSVGLATMRGWTFSQRRATQIEETIFDILNEVPEDEIGRAGFNGFLAAEVTNRLNLKNPSHAIKTVYKVMYGEDFEQKFQESKERLAAANAA